MHRTPRQTALAKPILASDSAWCSEDLRTPTVDPGGQNRGDDACLGALQVHQATDGALVRVRLPGGMLTAAQSATLATASSRFGSGKLPEDNVRE